MQVRLHGPGGCLRWPPTPPGPEIVDRGQNQIPKPKRFQINSHVKVLGFALRHLGTIPCGQCVKQHRHTHTHTNTHCCIVSLGRDLTNGDVLVALMVPGSDDFYTFCTFYPLDSWNSLRKKLVQQLNNREWKSRQVRDSSVPGVISSPIISSFVGHGLMNGALAPCYDWNLYKWAHRIIACV